MCMGKVDSSEGAIMWSSLVEHIIKLILYTAMALYSMQSALNSVTHQSYVSYSLLGLFTLLLIKDEVSISLMRLRRRLPPGYLGFHILRELKLVRMMVKGGINRSMEERRKKYGSFFAQSFLGNIDVVSAGQEDLNWMFNNDRKALTEVNWPLPIVKLLGPGAISNQSGKYHRVLRRLMEPYFAPKFVTNYLTSMDTTTINELERWNASKEFLSSEVFKMYALRLFYVSSFGSVDETVIASLHDDYTVWLRGFTSLVIKEIPGTVFADAMKARRSIQDTLDTLIDKFKAENPEDSERAQVTIIGRLIYGKDKDNNRMMTRQEINDNILTLIFAGHDTTFASISSILYHLSQNPDAMDALAKEVSTLSEPLDADELKNAPVLNACIHESLRMDPPVTGAFRKPVKEVHHKGFSFGAGAVGSLFYSILLATKDESLYEKPDKFEMRRFLPKDHPLYSAEKDSGINPQEGRSTYPVFGGGTHVCLGKAFAKLELRVLVTRILKHYTFEVRNPQKLEFPVNGWKIEFKLKKTKKE